MELSLYKALSSIKIEEPLVDAVIKAMDSHIDAGVSKSVIRVLRSSTASRHASTA